MLTMSFFMFRSCAWCGIKMGTREAMPSSAKKTTHSICKCCLNHQMLTVDAIKGKAAK